MIQVQCKVDAFAYNVHMRCICKSNAIKEIKGKESAGSILHLHSEDDGWIVSKSEPISDPIPHL